MREKWKDTPSSWFGFPGKLLQYVIDNVQMIMAPPYPKDRGLCVCGHSIKTHTQDEDRCMECPEGNCPGYFTVKDRSEK